MTAQGQSDPDRRHVEPVSSSGGPGSPEGPGAGGGGVIGVSGGVAGGGMGGMPGGVPGPMPFDYAERQKKLLLRVVRIGFLILFAVVTGLSLFGGGLAGGVDAAAYWPVTLAIAVVVAGSVAAVDLLTPTRKITTIVSVLVGLSAAMLATAAIGFVIDLLAQTYGDIRPDSNPVINIVKILIGTGLSYLAISTVLQTQDDFRLVIPYVEFAKQIRGTRPMVLDSSALIDERVYALAQTGAVQAPLVIPRFVIEELQALADSGDAAKRVKGRRALDLVGRMLRSPTLDVSVDGRPVPAKAVDQMLIELAKAMPGVIVTTDSGLARVAGIHDVAVVNMHELAAAVRPSVQPGERVRLGIVKGGEQAGQGVGYLADGTMVVVEDGADRIGEEVEAVAVSSVGTSAGRLIFARVVDGQRGMVEAAGPGEEGADTSVGRERESPGNGAERTGESGARPGTRPRRPASPRNPRR